MATFEQALAAWVTLMEAKADRPTIRFALSGDGSDASTADVANKPGWAWVRYDNEQHRASQVVNTMLPGLPQEMPLIIGKRYYTDEYVQILGVNWPLYLHSMTQELFLQLVVGQHGSTHNAITGTDPAYMDSRNLLPGILRAQDVPNLTIRVESLLYEYSGELARFSAATLSLAAYIPAAADTHRYVLITISASTNSLVAHAGDVVPTPVPPVLPTVPAAHVPIGVVTLANGQTEIEDADIADYRLLFGIVGGTGTETALGILEGELIRMIDTVMRIVQHLVVEVSDTRSELDRMLSVHIVDG